MVANIRRGRVSVFHIVGCVFSLVANARKSLRIKMAFLGDPEVTRALVAAANRGRVETVILFSREANIGNDLNYRTAPVLFGTAPVQLYRTPKMIHLWRMLVDDAVLLTGSANFSVFSMRKAEELDLLPRAPKGLPPVECGGLGT